MPEYFPTIFAVEITKSEKKGNDNHFTWDKLRSYQYFVGALNVLRHGVQPQASFASSFPQQQFSWICVSQLVTINKILHKLKRLQPIVTKFYPSSPTGLFYSYASDVSRGNSDTFKLDRFQEYPCLRGENHLLLLWLVEQQLFKITFLFYWRWNSGCGFFHRQFFTRDVTL